MVSVNLPTMMPVTRPRSDVIDFRVVAVIDSVVALEPLERIRPCAARRVRDCYVTFGEGHGLIGLKGHLYQRKPGDWRFKVTDLARSRRESDSGSACAHRSRSRLTTDKLPERTLETETVNFGVDGALVDGAGDWSPPEHVNLSLSLIGEDEPVETPARLVARQGALWDFKYEAIKADARNRLGSFIIDYQRDLMRLRNARYQAEVMGFDDDLDFWPEPGSVNLAIGSGGGLAGREAVGGVPQPRPLSRRPGWCLQAGAQPADLGPGCKSCWAPLWRSPPRPCSQDAAESVLIASRSAQMVEHFVFDHFAIHVRVTCPSGVPAVAGQTYSCYFEAPDGRYVAHIKVLSVHGTATQNKISTHGPLTPASIAGPGAG